MAKHKWVANKQEGAYKPNKNNEHKFKNKVDNNLKKKIKIIQSHKLSDDKLEGKTKLKKAVASDKNVRRKLGKKTVSLKSKQFQDRCPGSKEEMEFTGDISEQDIDSDDDLSLDENELPTPPDTTTTEDELSEEEELNENNQVEIQSERESEEHRTIFVGNLPKSVSKMQIKKWFSKYGSVECVRLRCAPLADPTIPKKLAVIKKSFHDERSNIHGFVRFATTIDANAALAANGKAFDGYHHLTVDIAGKVGQKKKFDDKKAVFIGNLPFSAEEDQLRDHFADCGDILCIRIVRDKHTAVGKGFAFINFTSRHSVRLALEKDGIQLNGRKLRIQKAVYNQAVEVIPVQKQMKRNKSRNEPESSSSCSTNIMKYKKKKKKSNEEFEFQGLSSKRDVKHKKIKKKKKKLKQNKEVLKKNLNSGVKNKNK